MTQIFSMVIGRTGITHKATHTFEKNEASFKFKPTKAMAPLSQLIVYSIHPTGEVIYDIIPMSFDMKFTTKVSFSNLISNGYLRFTSADDDVIVTFLLSFFLEMLNI